MTRPVGSILATAACLLLAAGCDAGGDDAIRLGVAVPADSTGGRSVQRGVALAVEEFNRAGGVGGRRVELEVRDDGGAADRAIAVAAELRDDPRVAAVIGHVNSSTTLAAAGVYNDPGNGVLEISPAASSPRLSAAGPWTFRVSPTDLAYGPAIARWLAGRGVRRAAVLYLNDEYGRPLAESFAAAFAAGGGTVVARDPFLPEVLEDDEAMRAYLARALGRGMEALVIGGTADNARRIVPAARRAGHRGIIIGADGLLGLEESGAAVDGTFLSAAFFADSRSPEAARFVRSYAERWGELPNADGALAYDAARVVLRALAEGGTGRREVRDYVAGIGTATPPYQGATGSIRFDRNGDAADKAVAVGVVRDRKVAAAES
jgi:branched-chain amino acid transport system substrate-binding protein